MRRNRRTLFFTLLVVTAALASTRAQTLPPDELNYQGVLRDASDAPLDGSHDMTFRFFDAAVDGDALLVDRHTAADSAPVVVTGGLFDVNLGTGSVSDGPGAGTFGSLSELFAATSEVWLELEVGGETLAPRVKVSSAAFALNAGSLGGQAPGSFLRSDVGDTFAGGELRFAAGSTLLAEGNPAVLRVDGANVTLDVDGTLRSLSLESRSSLRLNTSGSSSPQGIYFHSSAGPDTESLRWTTDHFSLSDDLWITSADEPLVLFNHSGTSTSHLSFDGFARQFDLTDDLRFGSTLTPETELTFTTNGPDGVMTYDASDTQFRLSDDLRLGSGFGTVTLGFYVAGISDTLTYDRNAGRFEFSDALIAPWLESSGNLFLRADGPDQNSFVYFYEDGSPIGESLRWDNIGDLFVLTDTVKVEQLDSQGNLHLRVDGPDGNGSIWFYENGNAFGERLFWNDTADRFEASEDFVVVGNFNLSGAKSVVQNHPFAPELSVVYTALEGDEAATFTRGTARLADGVARVPLGKTFAWVTHPEIGLTAHLTAREGPAALWVESLTTHELIVRGDPASAPDARFDYVVLGLRIGYEDRPAVRERDLDAPVPSRASAERYFERHPERRADTPLSRHTAMLERAGLSVPHRGAADALRAAIGTYEPDLPRAPHFYGDDTGDADERRTAYEVAHAAPEPADPEPTAVPGSDVGQLGDAVGPRSGTREPDAWLDAADEIEAGDVVALDPDHPGRVQRAATMADPGVLGVALGTPSRDESSGSPRVPLAVAGIATVRADASYGAIEPGDPLVTSPTAGHAMRALDRLPGTVLGKAIDRLDTGRGTVRVLLMSR